MEFANFQEMILISAFLHFYFALVSAEIQFQDTSQKNIPDFERGICFYDENFSLERIREGISAKSHQWPWYAALKIKNRGNNQYTGTCGATIVSNHFLLTGMSTANKTGTDVLRSLKFKPIFKNCVLSVKFSFSWSLLSR